jgi:cephalosporin hydroxylase
MPDFRDDYDIRCAGGSDIVGHLPYLYERGSKAPTIIELGVRSGESTCAFLAAAATFGGHVWSVDVRTPDVPEWWLADPCWTFIHGSDLEVDFLLPETCDLLFIDTSHQYRHTFNELLIYGPKVVDGGVILLHDTDLEVAPGSVADEDREFPVRRAVRDWCSEQGFAPQFLPGWHGLGVIEVDRG